MKKSLIFFVFFVLLLTHPANALENLSEKKAANIEKNAFSYDFAVDDGYIYYAKKDRDMFYIMKKNIVKNTKPEIIYSRKSLDEDFKKISFFNINSKLFAKIHRGAAFMGEDIYLELTENPVKNIAISSYESLAMDQKDRLLHLPFFAGTADCIIYNNEKFPLEKGGYYMFLSQKENDSFKTTNNNFLISETKIPLLKINKENFNPYDLHIYDFQKKKEEILEKNVSNAIAAKNCLYFTKDEGKNTKFYRYSKKSGKTEFLFKSLPYDGDIAAIGENLFFTGKYPSGKNSGLKNDCLFIFKNKKLSCHYTGDIKYFFSDGKNIALVTGNKNKSKIMIFDEDGKNISNTSIPLLEIKIYLSYKNLIAWSYLDQKVRYFEIPDMQDKKASETENLKINTSKPVFLNVNCKPGQCFQK